MLTITDLSFRHGERVLFDRASGAFSDGWKVGLVGRNGAGKSTLLRLIQRQIEPDSGTINIMGRTRIGSVPQDPPGGDITVLDAVLAADLERSALLAEDAECHDGHRLAEIHARLEEIGAAAAPSRAASILHGLGFDTAAQARPCGEYSGGWRMRVALAGTLFSNPDLLILDEPSNHLDLEAQVWLVEYLKRFRNTVLLVSHDRDLLNEVCDHIVHIDGEKLVPYTGNYDRFERTRAERLENDASQQVKAAAQRKHMQAFVDRFKATASKARQAQSRLKMIEKLGPIASVPIEERIAFKFPSPELLASPIETLDEVSVGYAGGPPVLRDLDLRLDMEDRIALLGQNGNGKSTFIRLLSERLKPSAGELKRTPRLRVGYFSQDQEEGLDYEETPFDHMNRALPGAGEAKVRSQLGRFGFSRDRANLKVGVLSGGEKTRLLLALATRTAPHLLLLDEPTNHLDMDSRASLVEALNDFEGAVVLVSHDTHLVRMVADTLWLVGNGTVQPFDGDVDEYQTKLLKERGGRLGKREDKQQADLVSKKDQRKAAADQRANKAPLKKAVDSAEKMLARLTEQLEGVAARLADPSIYAGPGTVVADLQREKGRLEREVANAEKRWLSAQEAFETAA